MNAPDPFAAMFIPFTVILLMNGGILWYFRRLYNRYLDLQANGVTATAVISGCRAFSTKGGRVLRVEYGFTTMTGDERKGRSDIAYSEEALKRYGAGSTFPILYSPEVGNKTTYPQEKLPEALKGLKKLNKIVPLVLSVNVAVMFYIFFFSHHNQYR